MASHAGIRYAVDHPDQSKVWSDNSNSIVILGVQSEDELLWYMNEIWSMNIPYSVFIEPDIGNEYTSFACVLPPEFQHIFSRLPLILRDKTDPRWVRENQIRQDHMV